MPGTGKSTVGALLANLLNYRLIDTDILLIEKYGMPLAELLSQKGVDTFLKLESEVGEQLVCQKTVIATGGSMVFSQTAMNNLMNHNVHAARQLQRLRAGGGIAENRQLLTRRCRAEVAAAVNPPSIFQLNR